MHTCDTANETAQYPSCHNRCIIYPGCAEIEGPRTISIYTKKSKETDVVDYNTNEWKSCLLDNGF